MLTPMSKYFKPGTYTKGDKTRNVQTATDAAQAVWDGFKASDEATDEQVEQTGPPSQAAPAARPTPPVLNLTGDDEA